MRKESSPFSFFSERTTSAFALPKKDSYPLKKLQQLEQERNRVGILFKSNNIFLIYHLSGFIYFYLLFV